MGRREGRLAIEPIRIRKRFLDPLLTKTGMDGVSAHLHASRSSVDHRVDDILGMIWKQVVRVGLSLHP